EALNGVAFDPALRRSVPRSQHTESLPELGQVVLPAHLAFNHEQSGKDRPALVSRGMSKFGLPDLELRGVPDDLIKESTAILGGLAALLAGWAMPLRDASEGKPFKAGLDREWQLTKAQILAAHAVDPSDPTVGPGGSTTIRFESDRPSRSVPLARLRVVPASGPADDPETAVRRMVAEVFNVPTNYSEFPDDLPGLDEARARVAAEIPEVKARFLAGLPTGSSLFVKYGLPIDGDRKEYIWAGVESWSDRQIRAKLENDPVRRADLRRGQDVELDEGDIFDWLITHSDGRKEGAA